MESVGRERLSVIAAFGCGIALTATVAGIYTKIKSSNHGKRTISEEALASKLDLLNETIEQLRKDVEEIKLASIRGSPFSLRPLERLDIDRLEDDELETNATIDGPLSHPHHHSHNHFNHHRKIEAKRFEPINSDPYTSSDETEEFFDFNDSETNLQPELGIIRARDDEAGPKEGINNEPVSSKFSNNHIEPGLDDYLNDVDSVIDDPKADIQALHEKLCQAESKFGSNAQILWRKAKVCHLLGSAAEKQGGKEKKKEFAFEMLENARKALELDDKCVESHKWYAIAIGSITDYVGTKEKIENGYMFKKHLDYALELKPDDATLHYLLGRWACEVSNLSWLEKKLAASLFAQLPDTNANEALQSLMKAYEIKPDWKQNIYFICKTLITLKRTKEALEWIEKGLECKIENDDDQITHEKFLSLRAKYSK